MKFFNLEREEYKKYVKQFRNTFVGGRLFIIFRFILEFIAISLAAEFIVEVVLEKETYVYDTIILWIMGIVALISYYQYFKYLKEYIEKVEK